MELDALRTHWEQFRDRLAAVDLRLFTLGDVDFTVGSLLKLAALAIALMWFAGRLREVTVNRALRHTALDPGSRQAVGAVVRYLVILIGGAVIVQNAGVDLTTLGVVAGAISVGVGFGLQNIVSNFVSGLIIMLERPIKVGDRIRLADIEGSVSEVGARRTAVVTADNVAILIPNQRFITENVTNLMYTGSAVRARLPFTLAAGRPADAIVQVLLDVASRQPGVLALPAPEVLRPRLEPAAVVLELCVWYDPVVHVRETLVSALNARIEAALAERGEPPPTSG